MMHDDSSSSDGESKKKDNDLAGLDGGLDLGGGDLPQTSQNELYDLNGSFNGEQYIENGSPEFNDEFDGRRRSSVFGGF